MPYSQHDEERHILAAFEGFAPTDVLGTHLRFLDLGAGHPKQLSNTRALYELGWHGVMVEAGPVQMLDLLREYGNDGQIQLVHAAVGVEKILAPLHVSSDLLSTGKPERIAAWPDGWLGKMLVPQITLSDIGTWFGAFDFVNIDTEGSSADLAIVMLGSEWRPHCFCVEHDSRLEELASIATGQGYSITYVTGENAVFVRQA